MIAARRPRSARGATAPPPPPTTLSLQGRGPLRRRLFAHGARLEPRRLEEKIAAARRLGPVPPRLVIAAPPRIALDGVGAALARRPALRLVVVAFALAVVAHLALGGWSMSLRPHKAKAARIEMVTASPLPVEELPAEEPVPPEVEPEPPPPTTKSAASVPAPSAPEALAAAAPGPIVSGLSPLAGAGSGLGVQVGGGGGPAAAVTRDGASAQPPRVEPPRPRRRGPPEYPRKAREQGLEGFVALHILVDDQGRVAEVCVLEASPPGVFDAAAVLAARRWTFAPGRSGGAPVEAWVRQVVRFALD